MLRIGSLLLSVSLLTAACGTTAEDRGLTGAGLGAIGGAIIGAVTGLSVLEGALIGTGVGGVTGLLTDADDIYLGEPIWDSWFGGGTRTAAAGGGGGGGGGGSDPTVASVQSRLSNLGYGAGPADGIYGPNTNAAIRAYQSDNGLPVDGHVSRSLVQRLQGGG